MSERKVLNKYIPPDFDPKNPQRSMRRGGSHTVRLMTPFSMRCNTCGEYIYKRKKFNARKETLLNEDYLGIKIFRFYIRCPRCAAEITFKTDPKNTDYVAEWGAQRNFEPWRDDRFVAEELEAERKREEEANPMKALENKTFDSKREMEILDALDEIRTINARAERVNADDLLQKIIEEGVQEEDEEKAREEAEDDALAKSIFQSAADGERVRRLVSDEPDDIIQKEDELLAIVDPKIAPSLPSFENVFKADTNALGVKRKAPSDFGVVVKRKSKTAQVEKEDLNGKSLDTSVPLKPDPMAPKTVSAVVGLVSGYSDSDDE